MATLAGALTLADWAKRFGENEKLTYIVEMLSQENGILDDMLVSQANNATGHTALIRTGLPTPTWRLLNQGVVPTKSTTAQIVFGIGNLEDEVQIDVDVAALNGDAPRFRSSENIAHMMSMSQTMATTLLYGNSLINPERFTGLSAYYSTVSSASSQTALNVIDAGGTGSDNTSIWCVTWSEKTIHGIFPPGSQAGLKHEDMGKWRVADASAAGAVTGGYYWAWVDHYQWKLGLAVEDWRYAARICNIDVSDLNTASAANLLNLMTFAANRLPTTNGILNPTTSSDAPSIQGMMGRTAFYMNRTVRQFMEIQAMNKTNALLTLEQASNGKTVPTFRGIPIRTVDALVNNETRVT